MGGADCCVGRHDLQPANDRNTITSYHDTSSLPQGACAVTKLSTIRAVPEAIWAPTPALLRPQEGKKRARDLCHHFIPARKRSGGTPVTLTRCTLTSALAS